MSRFIHRSTLDLPNRSYQLYLFRPFSIDVSNQLHFSNLCFESDIELSGAIRQRQHYHV